MTDLNLKICYHKQTNSWWITENLDGFTLRKYISEYPIGLGTIEFDCNDKSEIQKSFKYLYEVSSVFIPNYIKQLNGITYEIEENGFENAVKVSSEELVEILKEH